MKQTKGVLRVGMLGLGVVGTGVAEILQRHRELIAHRSGVEVHIVRALVRSRRRRQGAAAKVATTRDAYDIVQAPDIDIVVELMGGERPAVDYMLKALKAGKPVVTANKAVVARHGARLFKAASAAHVDLYFEAAVAGGIPIIRTLREGLAADRITLVRGILNGTTNYILGQLQQGRSYAEALAEAQALGYAEADPTLDVSGGDAADKLAILINLAFGTQVQPKDLPCEGITHLTPEVLSDAAELGYSVKLVARAQRLQHGGAEWLDARVHPALVPLGDVLSHVPANQNAVTIASDALGDTLYQGAGAGSLPTGSAVVADLIEAARNMRGGVSGRLATPISPGAPKLIQPGDAKSAYYMRLLVDDRPGVLASVTKILAAQQISMATVLQRERGAGPVPLVLMTHTTSYGRVLKALSSMGKIAALHTRPHVLRMEERSS